MLQLQQCLDVSYLQIQTETYSNSLNYYRQQNGRCPSYGLLYKWYMFSYHTDNCYLIWSSDFIVLICCPVTSLLLNCQCIFLVEMKRLLTSMCGGDLFISPHLMLVAEIINAISRDQIATQQATSWLLMWLLHLHWIPTESERWFCPWHKHAIEVQGWCLLQSSGLLHV